ncbi:13261_t:CDS:2 [Dentiscutata erythropus]|uniref:13261_t:CDS:1 n=1 Tax=Dentiscutata erythropus TaxID=1348616 RepID=A0A9N9N5Z5_9GLOM|nr:13261_t:CDS:2 [Dentiscutata erythropus]
MSDRKLVILTGANSGLGFEVLKQLLSQETPYHIILAVRNIQQTETKINSIVPSHQSVEIVKLDLSSLTSVKSFTQNILSRKPSLHINILILNAGVVKATLTKTDDGFEHTFQVNHLSNVILVHELLPRLIESGPDSRIILVNSSLHKPGTGSKESGENRPILDIENLDGSKMYFPLLFYRNSKLAQVLFGYQLDKFLNKKGEEERKVNVSIVEPGFCPTTELARESAIFTQFFLKYILSWAPFTRTSEQGGAVITYAAISSELENKSGLYINRLCQIDKSSDESYDEEKQKFWWKTSCDLLGIEEDWSGLIFDRKEILG